MQLKNTTSCVSIENDIKSEQSNEKFLKNKEKYIDYLSIGRKRGRQKEVALPTLIRLRPKESKFMKK